MTQARVCVHPTIEFLHDTRRRKGLTRTQVSARSGYSVRAIEYWEWGWRTPSLESLIGYAGALGYDLTLTPKEGSR